jgi:phosphatidylserine/phosphatidylglycerophosphate/cardiolipin synthase-like enzyme
VKRRAAISPKEPILHAPHVKVGGLAVLLVLVATYLNPAVYFTDNWAVTGPPPGATQGALPITPLEQGLLDRLNTAAVSIDAALYDFSRPSLRDALIAAHNRGVHVRIVTDDEARATATSAPFYAALAAAGIPMTDDGDDGRLMHNKYAVIDGRVVWTGSTNWSENDIVENHNNAVVFDSAAVAQIFAFDFEQIAAGLVGSEKVPSPVTTVLHAGSPLEIYFSPQDDALDKVIAAVNSAQATIDFAIFSFTDDALRDALLAAHGRGVRVRGIFDELGAGNASSEDEVLCAAGVPVRLEQTFGKMHNKLMVIDSRGTAPKVVTGSLNWSASGDDRNSENIVIIHDRAVAQAYAGAFVRWWYAWKAAPPLGCTLTGPRARAYLGLDGGAAPEATPAATPPATPPAPGNMTPVELPGACACGENSLNCTDFATQNTAQQCFDTCWRETGRDVYDLDSDGDGEVCESLPLDETVIWEDAALEGGW